MKVKLGLCVVSFMLIAFTNSTLNLVSTDPKVNGLINKGAIVCLFLYILFLLVTFLTKAKVKKSI